MGFTIEDMRIVSGERYKMKLLAGGRGWSNSISWLLMLEDLTIIQNFSGKELAVTTGLGFQSEEKMLQLVEALSAHDASGLIINTGYYIKEIPESILEYCDEHDLPLLTVPWEVFLADMIKDLSVRVFLQSQTDEQISGALLHAIEEPEQPDLYRKELLPHFDLDGSFQTALITADGLDSMDTVERKRISYRMQLYITNLTHNGHFFYYASCFVLVMNAVPERQAAEILNAFAERAEHRFTDLKFYIGVSDPVMDISRLHLAYKRALAAVGMARREGKRLQYFRDMGLYRLLSRIEDRELLSAYYKEKLQKLEDSDREHGTEYLETLRTYLECEGSIREVSERMYIHRNTILYRMAHIRQILGDTLDSPSGHMEYRIAFMVRDLGEQKTGTA